MLCDFGAPDALMPFRIGQQALLLRCVRARMLEMRGNVHLDVGTCH
jgi:hypothetical protein